MKFFSHILWSVMSIWIFSFTSHYYILDWMSFPYTLTWICIWALGMAALDEWLD